MTLFKLRQRQRSLLYLIIISISKVVKKVTKAQIIQKQHCLALALLSISIAQHQHCLALSLLSISIAQRQHCLVLALLSIRIAYRQHCLTLALLSISIAQHQHCLSLVLHSITENVLSLISFFVPQKFSQSHRTEQNVKSCLSINIDKSHLIFDKFENKRAILKNIKVPGTSGTCSTVGPNLYDLTPNKLNISVADTNGSFIHTNLIYTSLILRK